MNITTEIEKKEKSLTELMVRILKDPLTPIETSMKGLNETLLDSKDLIDEVNNSIGASTDIIEKIKSKVTELYDERIKSEDISAVINRLKEDLDVSFDERLRKHEEQINIIFESVIIKLTAIQDGQPEVKQLFARLGDQLTSISQKIESEHTTTAKKIDTTYKAIANDIENSSASITEKLAENLIDGEKKSAQQQNNHIELLDALTQQQTVLREQLAINQRKLTKLTTVIGIYFFFTFAFICYDIWHQFHW